MKEFIRQFRLWRVRRKITQAIRRIQAAQDMRGANQNQLAVTEKILRCDRRMHNP